MQKFKQQIEQELEKIQQALDSSSLSDLRRRAQSAINDARSGIDKHLEEFEKANQVADQYVDSYLEQATRSKWSAVIVAVYTMFAVAAGVVVGMHL